MSGPGAIYRIRQTAAGLVHIHERHVRRDFPKYRGKSKFDPDADLPDLIRQAEHFEPALRPDGDLVTAFPGPP